MWRVERRSKTKQRKKSTWEPHLQSLDQSAGSSGEKIVLECTLSGRKSRPSCLFRLLEGGHPAQWLGVECSPLQLKQILKERITGGLSAALTPHSWASPTWKGKWAASLCISRISLQGFVLFCFGNWLDEVSMSYHGDYCGWSWSWEETQFSTCWVWDIYETFKYNVKDHWLPESGM